MPEKEKSALSLAQRKQRKQMLLQRKARSVDAAEAEPQRVPKKKRKVEVQHLEEPVERLPKKKRRVLESNEEAPVKRRPFQKKSVVSNRRQGGDAPLQKQKEKRRKERPIAEAHEAQEPEGEEVYEEEEDNGGKQFGGPQERKYELRALPDSWKKATPPSASMRRNQIAKPVSRKRLRGSNAGDDLLNSFQQRLSGSTFRLLNEQLYTSASALGAQLLRDEETFNEYHDGYRQQLAMWPIHPALVVADSFLHNKFGHFSLRHYQFGTATGRRSEIGYRGHAVKSGKGDGKPIPGNYVIADMGCGDADIARSLSGVHSATVHSFDFRAANSLVTATDMAHVPLPSESVDIVVFSLSLMSTNFMDYLFEARRILKKGRLLKIVEVRSRFPNPGDFVWLIQELGFSCEGWGVLVDYFCVFDFSRHVNDGGRLVMGLDELSGRVSPNDVLLPCLYKRR